MNKVVHRVGRIRLVFWMVLCAAMAWLFSSPGLIAVLRAGNMHGKLSFINMLPPDGRAAAGYGLAALFALGVLGLARLVFDSRIVIIDDDGITVRSSIFVERGCWSEFSHHRFIGWGRYRTVQLRFSGTRGKAKVTLPNGPFFGLDQRAVLLEALIRAHVPVGLQETVRHGFFKKNGTEKTAPERPAARGPFGGRATAETPPASPTRRPTVRHEPVIQEGRRVFGRRPAGR